MGLVGGAWRIKWVWWVGNGGESGACEWCVQSCYQRKSSLGLGG